MDCTCTFLIVYHLGTLRKHYLFLHLVKISHVSIWNWIQKYKPTKKINEKKKINEYSCIQKDETTVKVYRI